jgi:hypothetical protein
MLECNIPSDPWINSQLTMSIHWPCYGIVHLMLPFIFVIVCGLFEWKWLCAVFFIFCLYIYCLWITPSYQEWRIEIPFTVLTPPNCVPVPNQDLDLQRHMSLSFCVQWVRLSNAYFGNWKFWVLNLLVLYSKQIIFERVII